jgi:hypothetical protein
VFFEKSAALRAVYFFFPEETAAKAAQIIS